MDAAAAGAVPELCAVEVIVAVWREEGEGGEAFDDGFLVPGSLEALEELLVDKARGHDVSAISRASSPQPVAFVVRPPGPAGLGGFLFLAALEIALDTRYVSGYYGT